MSRRGMAAMRGRMGTALALLALAALALASCTSTVSTSAKRTPTATPAAITTHVEKGKCPFAVAAGATEGASVICYRLTVPENQASPQTKPIQVAAALFKTATTPAAPDPIIFLQGGPGGRLIQDLGPSLTPAIVSVLFGSHDVILVDQRGTGYSTPSLKCPEVDALQYQTDSDLSIAQQNAKQADALAACRSRLTGEGVDLSAYTTLANANDVHDLITSLGYQQVDLYGVSYGTRLVLEMLRSFPQYVRSAVLDSTVPPQLKLITNIPYATNRVFTTLFQGCAKDAACDRKYPNLQTVFYQLYAQLNAHPLTFQVTDTSPEDDVNSGNRYTVKLHGDDLVNLTFTTFYDTGSIPKLPKMIYELKNGVTTTAADLYGKLIFSQAISWGMYFSVECAEDVDTVAQAQLEQAGQAYNPAIRQNQLAGLEGELGECKLWNVPPAPASQAQPVTSAIPTLILKGEYDPVTPPSNGDLVAKTLSHSYEFLFPGTGHGVWASDFATNPFGVPCSIRLTLAFWDTPTARPDGSCVAGVPEPAFE